MNIETLITQLNHSNGYIREKTLRQLQTCFEPVLFPHLIERLSDYVEINRILAYEHFKLWRMQPNFTMLFLKYFSEISAIQHRIRYVDELDSLLFDQVIQNLDEIKPLILKQTGPLSRALYRSLKDQQKMELAQHAVDPVIRREWINYTLQQDMHFIENEFIHTKYLDVKKAILQFLITKEYYHSFIFIEALKIANFAILDLSTFALKKQNFDFDHYIDQLISSPKLKLYLIILLKYNETTFFEALEEISDKNLVFSLLLKALRFNYITRSSAVSFLQKSHFRYEYNSLKKIISTINIQGLQTIYSLCDDDAITIKMRLEIYNHLSTQEKIAWLCEVYKYCQTTDDHHLLYKKLNEVFSNKGFVWKHQITQQEFNTLEKIFNQYRLEKTNLSSFTII